MQPATAQAPGAPGTISAPGVRWEPGALLLGAALGWLPGPPAAAQQWHDLQGRTRSGIVELHQAVLDAASDSLALLVASHPDDRYVLPASVLRFQHGMRVAVLLATRGGGGQNSRGPETGDALERIRTLEAEAGCWVLGADAWYLNRPDGGYCRTAQEAFGEWGRDGTLRDLVRLIRTIRPDLVLTTHHAEESHGHDQALVDVLPEAVLKAADPDYAVAGWAPHRVQRFFMGATSSPPAGSVRLLFERIEPIRGETFRRLAYDTIARTHVSAGPMLPMEHTYESEAWLAPGPGMQQPVVRSLVEGLRSMFDVLSEPPDDVGLADARRRLEADLGSALLQPDRLVDQALQLHEWLRQIRAPEGGELARRVQRRIEALQRLVRLGCGIQIEVEAEAGAVAVPGEELLLAVRIHNGSVRDVDAVELESLGGARVTLETIPATSTPRVVKGMTLRGAVTYHTPLLSGRSADPMVGAFAGDRFVPPVQLRFHLVIGGQRIPVRIDVPVEMRAPVEVDVVPPMLLLPSQRQSVKFTVAVQRNSRFPVRDVLEMLVPAGYVVAGNRKQVDLRATRGDSFDFELRAPDGRGRGVDVMRMRVGDQRLPLPVHRVDVSIDPKLRLGAVLGNDDALLSVVGLGGFGLNWSELSDADLAVRDLSEFDTIVVDVRALRDRPRARRSYRRLLDFAGRSGKRLLVFYHKDTEFHPAGEGFVGAPFLPFQIGRGRVTRADAPVRILLPDHVLLRSPNVILPGDWDAWEQERGLYFPSVYAEQYQELLEMADPGQPQERSALLYARTGDGEFVYCALALYRQLKKLHPGAVRLLANLLTPSPR